MTYESSSGSGPSTGNGGDLGRDTEVAAGKAVQLKEDLKDSAQQGLEAARDAARQGMDRVRDEARNAAERTRTRVAESSGVFASAVKRAADTFEEKGETGVAGFARALADGIDRVGNDIKNRSTGELVEDLESLTRRNPAAVIGGAAIAGFCLSRFLLSSERRESRTAGATASAGERSDRS